MSQLREGTSHGHIVTVTTRVGHADTSADAHHPHMSELCAYAAHMSYSATAWPTLVTKAIVLIALYAKGIFIVFILFIYFVKRMKH